MGEGVSRGARAGLSAAIGAPPPHDYIRTYLGLMGSGKTTQALRDLEGRERVIIFGPGSTNPLMLAYPFIYDTPNYTKDWNRWLAARPRLRIEKRVTPTPIFRLLSHVRGYTILLDDVATLKVDAGERAEFESFVRTIRFNQNNLILTTHRARKDLPPLVHVVGTSFYYVGPALPNSKEFETLYELVNYPISYEEFSRGLSSNPARDGDKAAGVYPIRRA